MAWSGKMVANHVANMVALRHRRLLALAASVALALCSGRALLAQEAANGDAPKPRPPQEQTTDLQQLVGKRLDIQALGGKQFADAEVLKVVPGTAPGSIKSLTAKVTAAGRQQLVGGPQIVELFLDGTPLDVTYDAKTRELSHDPAKREARLKHAAEVQTRLAGLRHKLWPDLTPEQHAEWIAKHKAFLQEVSAALPGTNLQLVETKYYLFYTDIAPNRVGGYIAYLDAMYEHLCKAFNIPEGKNIWCGKCVVIAFQQQETFNKFETLVMNNPNPQAQGICHGSTTGRVVIGIWKGEHEAFFGKVLVHETAHGFVHRYKSSVFIPSWVNEGIADWVAAAVVAGDTSVRQRQRDAAQRVQQTGSLGGNFFDEEQNIEGWQYGVASNMVTLLLVNDRSKTKTKYKDFLDLMKEGLTPAEALKETYGATLAQLVTLYGQSIGVPNLQP